MNSNKSYISVVSGEKWVKSSPKLFWGTDNPNSQDYILGVNKQLELEGCIDIKILDFNHWNFIGSRTDWIQSGLDGKQSVNDLFNRSIAFSTSKGEIGVRLEYYIKIYTDNLILWRENSLNLIKGKIDNDIPKFLRDNYCDYVTMAFKMNL